MKRLIHFIFVLVLLSGGLIVNIAQAEGCTANTALVTVPTETYNMPSAGVPMGAVISDWIEMNSPFASNCPSPIYSISANSYNSSTGMTYTENGITYPVLVSGVTGVGFIAAIKAGTSGVFVPIPGTGTFTLLSNTGQSEGNAINVDVKIKFISTGTLTPGVYTIPPLYLVGAYMLDSIGTKMGQGFAQSSSFTLNITASTCNVTTASLNVRLADVSPEDLPVTGSTAKEQLFNVGLNCQSGVYIYAQLNGVQDNNSTADGVLQIDNYGTASASQGVGIQILNGTTPMPLGTHMPVRFSNGGTENLPFTARYFRTTANMAAGSANATATLTMTYQ
ncbi:fimbrial protein [Scandinavium sp. TWS1a]|uniref:fimbrial protein n=1 Tax=Scandinavium tedordense TaxID=2926521 RepID=UPI0021651456|nr:fimbrial protein [Scandinavium tedordense]MCS2171959.1 fimbrial protein [Scandinavium tedordense]